MTNIPSKAPLVLIVDDDSAARRSVQDLLTKAGYNTVGAATAADARRFAENEEPALAILDLVLLDGDGLSLLADLRALWPAMPALIVTGYVETRSVVEAMRRGAADYLAKPVDPEVLLSACRTALARRIPPSVAAPVEALPLVGESAALARIRETVQRLARSRPAGLLVTGEHGTGKTWITQALHAASARRHAPCLLLACATSWDPAVALLGIPGSTGGGLLAAAQGGTVVLDDVERLDSEVQLALLRHVESDRTAPLLVGLTTDAETSSPLLAWLGRATIAVPPLRDRTSDILPLARQFLAEAGSALGRRFDGFTRPAEHRLLGHTWPDNVRELKESVLRAARVAAGGAVGPEHLCVTVAAAPPPWAPTGDPRPLREIEDAYIDHVLAVAGGNKTRAARILGVARETLRTKMLSRHTTTTTV
jgi:two-component system response regulator HydG